MNKKVFLSWFFALALFVLPLGGCGAAEEETLPDFESLRKISSTNCHTALIDGNGDLWTWGDNSSGQLGDGQGGVVISDFGAEFSKRHELQRITEGKHFVQVATGSGNTFVLDEEGCLWGCGSQLLLRSENVRPQNHQTTLIPILESVRFASISCSGHDVLAIDTDGNLWAWSAQTDSFVKPRTLPSDPTILLEGKKFIKAVVGYEFYFAIDSGGQLWSWGNNSHGQLGNGTVEKTVTEPQRVCKDMKFADIAPAGETSTYAIDADGHLWACGENTYGQLGDGSKKDSSVFVRMITDRTFKRIGGFLHSGFAIDDEGQLWFIGGRNGLGGLEGWPEYEEMDPARRRETIPLQVLDGVKFSQLSEYGDMGIAANGDVYILQGDWATTGRLGTGSDDPVQAPKIILSSNHQ